MGKPKFVYVTFIRATPEKYGRRLPRRTSPRNIGSGIACRRTANLAIT